VAAAPEHYAGREQAYVKHFLLRNYFSDLIHKVASGYDNIVYVDGFSGPWQSADDDLRDTSFGIALGAMRSAKAAWKLQGRDVHMHAMLVEKRARAFRELQKVPAKYPDIDVRPYRGEFVPLVPTLLRDMPQKSFAFIFIDPKGWRIDIDALAPLLRRPNAEVLFNFMFDFINRAASMSDPAIVAGLDALIKTGGWRERLISARPEGSRPLADIRKEILVDAFSQTLAEVGRYDFVAETPIFRPLADWTLYSLIYATRQPPGIEVFRKAQIKTLREQETVRGNVRQAKYSGPQMDAFLPSEMTSSETEVYLASERLAAERMLLDLADATPPRTYGEVWPKVLAKHAVRKTDLNRIAAAFRKDGRLVFPDWEPGKRVPSNAWHLHSRIRRE
jgi:three-Cys-motif partner protein